MQNNSKDDARYRIMNARIGYLAGNPTYEYLSELQRQLADWSEDVQLEIKSMTAKSQEDEAKNITECSPIDDQVTAAAARTPKKAAKKKKVAKKKVSKKKKVPKKKKVAKKKKAVYRPWYFMVR